MGLLFFYLQVIVPAFIFAHKLPKRSHFVWRVILSTGLSFGLCYAAQMLFRSIEPIAQFSRQTHIAPNIFIMIAFSMALIWGCFDCSPKVAILCGSSGYAVQNCVYYLKRILMMLFTIDHGRYDNLTSYIVFSTAYLLFLCIDHWWLKTDFKGEVQNTLAVGFPLSVLLINVVLSAFIPWSDDTMLYCLYAFLLSLSMIVIQMGAFNLASAKVEKKVLEQIISAEQKQHTVYEDTVTLINRKCHDIKNEVGVLLRKENQSIRTEEIRKVQDMIDLYGVFLKTGNPTLDIILTEKKILCDSDNILFTCVADGAALDAMETVDMCVLLGNALDNAIESTKKEERIENRFISMNLARRGSMVSIHIENTCCGNLRYSGGELLTDKQDAPGFHGFGMKSMNMIAEKYGGNISSRKIGDIFYLDILFPAENGPKKQKIQSA